MLEKTINRNSRALRLAVDIRAAAATKITKLVWATATDVINFVHQWKISAQSKFNLQEIQYQEITLTHILIETNINSLQKTITEKSCEKLLIEKNYF